MTKLSDSSVQGNAERELVRSLQADLKCNLVAKTLPFGDMLVKVDGYSEERRILCEAYAHVGSVKGSQYDKPLCDALKMHAIAARLRGKWRKILVFADSQAARTFEGNGWRAVALRELGVEVNVAHVAGTTLKSIRAAQRRQRMTNARHRARRG